MKNNFKKVALTSKLGVGLICILSALTINSAQATSSTIQKIKSSGSVTIGVRESSGALSYKLGNDKYAGFHVELCRKVIRDLQQQLKLPSIKIQYQPVTAENRIPLVQDGTVDIECGSTTNTLARQKDVAFAVTTYVEEVRMAVRADSGITSISQLTNKVVATTTGTTSIQLLRQHERAKDLSFEVILGKDHADSFLLLESGRADAFVMDTSTLAGNIANAKKPKDFKIVGEILSVEPIAIMMRKDDPEFKQAIDDSIIALMKNGTIAKMYNKWFLGAIPPRGQRVGLELSLNTKAAWAKPNDLPIEDYMKKKITLKSNLRNFLMGLQ